MKYQEFLVNETIVKKALSLEIPDVGGTYAPEKAKRYIGIIDKALAKMKGAENNDANDAIVADLVAKKKKWSNIGKETAPAKTAGKETAPAKTAEPEQAEEDPNAEKEAEAEADAEEEKAKEEEEKGKEKERDEEEKAKAKAKEEEEKEKAKESKFQESITEGIYQCKKCKTRFDKPYVFENSTFEDLGPVCPKCFKRPTNEGESSLGYNVYFVVGRKVNDWFGENHVTELRGLKPNDKDFANAAKALKIKKKDAVKAWNLFTWGK